MICELCQNQEGQQLPTIVEVEQLRHALLVTAPIYRPVVCETCVVRAMSHQPKLGVENLLLRHA